MTYPGADVARAVPGYSLYQGHLVECHMDEVLLAQANDERGDSMGRAADGRSHRGTATARCAASP
jgi:hypothetical protein